MPSYQFYNLFSQLSNLYLKPFRSFIKKEESETSYLLLLYDYLRKFHPHFDDDRLTPTLLHQKLYGKDVPVRRKLILNQLSSLKSLLLNFLITEKLNSTPELYQFIQLIVLAELKQPDMVSKTGFKLEKILQKNKTPNCWEFIFRSRLYEELLKNEVNTPQSKNLKTLKKLLNSLDEGANAARYKYLAASVKYQEFFEEDIVDLETYFLNDEKILSTAYQLCFLLESKNRESTFQELEEIVKNRHEIHLDDKYELLTSLINFAARQIKSGKKHYLSKALELYKFGLNSKILLHGSGLTPGKFTNIVSTGCYLGEFDWTINFIHQYYAYLSDSKRIEIKNLSLANVKLESGEVEHCIEILSGVLFTDVIYNLRSKILIIRALYNFSIPDEDLILQECRKFRRFLSSQRSIQGSNKLAAINFIKIMVDLTKRKKSREKISETIDELGLLFHKNWIKNKLASYKKR